jgi:DNA polymerase-3 subunit gamma/tau
MSYTALARRWRPRTFAELIGQEHVRVALENALTANRVHHAFLFTGTRGVGKTTIARILAKCLNCETGVTATPCGVCAACREIDEGRFVDLLEVDAASRTKVDDTRELLENVQYAPARGRYKVYLIDEVHMLSAHSFNALLKTLEEPPPHVKFLLATTDPQKLPVTVLSRCLQFNLKRIPVALIIERLRTILDSEKLAAEPAALRLVAVAADGSLRDALSLTDQLIAFGGGTASEAAARAMLGTIDHDRIGSILKALAAGDACELLAAARALEEWAPDYGFVLDEIARVLVAVALTQRVPGYAAGDCEDPALVAHLATAMTPEDVQLDYQTAILGRRDLALAPDPRSGFEMTLLRMLAFRLPRPELTGERSGAGARSTRRADSPPMAGAPSASAHSAGAPTAAPAALSAQGWGAFVATLELSGVTRQLASHCAFVARQGPVVRLALAARHAPMQTRAQEERLAQALARQLGEPVRLEIDVVDGDVDTPAADGARRSALDLESARDALLAEPGVRALQERFGATLHPDTVRTVNK